jgi:hypothetical protein
MAQSITLTRDKCTLVDDEDYERLSRWKWSATLISCHWRAVRSVKKRGRSKTIYMAREIVGAKKGEYVDHINHDSLDNRRCNLRICSNAANGANQQKRRQKCTSKFKGVSWHKKSSKWTAYIIVKQKWIYLGVFASELQAATAYNKAALEHFGEYACLNPVGEDYG